MKTANQTEALHALDSDDDAIVDYTAAILDQGEVVWDEDGDSAGVTYYDAGMQEWYAADVDDCRKLLEAVGANVKDAYSHWCAVTDADGYATRDEATDSL
jgi:hypothetical protein